MLAKTNALPEALGKAKNMLADSGYFSEANVNACAAAGIEPLIVHPQKGARGSYVLLDGHMRLKALGELGRTEVFCLVANDDDAFTYNDKVNRLSLIQEHAMILRAVDNGVH